MRQSNEMMETLLYKNKDMMEHSKINFIDTSKDETEESEQENQSLISRDFSKAFVDRLCISNEEKMKMYCLLDENLSFEESGMKAPEDVF